MITRSTSSRSSLILISCLLNAVLTSTITQTITAPPTPTHPHPATHPPRLNPLPQLLYIAEQQHLLLQNTARTQTTITLSLLGTYPNCWVFLRTLVLTHPELLINSLTLKQQTHAQQSMTLIFTGYPHAASIT